MVFDLQDLDSDTGTVSLDQTRARSAPREADLAAASARGARLIHCFVSERTGVRDDTVYH